MTQRWDPEVYRRTAAFVPALGRAVVDRLDPRPGERILDLGCGDGSLTAEIRRRGAAVVGLDASPEFVAAARANGIDAVVGDGQALAFAEQFDAVFSNAALHWMPDAAAVVDGVWRALRPGGRFVAEFGGAGNVAAVVAALTAALGRRGIDAEAVHPWFFPTPQHYRALLERRGFVVAFLEHFARPTPLPGSVRDWLATFAGPFTARVPAPDRGTFLDEVTEALRPVLLDDQGTWTIDYVRLRVAAFTPEASRVRSAQGLSVESPP